MVSAHSTEANRNATADLKVAGFRQVHKLPRKGRDTVLTDPAETWRLRDVTGVLLFPHCSPVHFPLTFPGLWPGLKPVTFPDFVSNHQIRVRSQSCVFPVSQCRTP